MKLIELRAENFKRLKAICIRPKGAVTPIVGRNGAGKTSALDAIAAALGGASECPELPIRRGATKAEVLVDLGDIVVRRKWSAKGTTLEVVAADGSRVPSPQAVLDRMLGHLSFDPLEFARMKPADQAKVLAKVAGIDLDGYRTARSVVFEQRTTANRKEKEAKSQLDGLALPAQGTPDEEVSLAEILEELKAAEAVNAEHKRLEATAQAAAKTLVDAAAEVERLRSELIEAETQLSEADSLAKQADTELHAHAEVDAEPIRQRGKEAEQVNRNVRTKKQRERKLGEVNGARIESESLSQQIADMDAEFARAIANAKLPIPGLSIEDNAVFMGGIPFGQCSGAERLRASVAIGFALNPTLKLMLIRDGSLLDDDGMLLLAEIAEKSEAQVLIERVAKNGEVGVRIEDGEIVEEEATKELETAAAG